jgi:serine/threonine protein kinase
MGAAPSSTREHINTIGSGGFGTVAREWNMNNNKEVVTKYFKQPDAHVIENTTEIAILKYLQGLPYINQIIRTSTINSNGTCLSYPCVVMRAEEYSLQTLIDDTNKSRLPWDTAFTLCVDILQAYNVLHSSGIIHRDTKPRNILIRTSQNNKLITNSNSNPIELMKNGESLHALLSDFGGSVFTLPTIPYLQDGYTGTYQYSSPEVLLRDMIYGASPSDYTYTPEGGFAQDAWGVGMVLFYLLTRSTVFFSTSAKDDAINQLYATLTVKGLPTASDGDTYTLYNTLLPKLNPKARSMLSVISVSTNRVSSILNKKIPTSSSCRKLIPIIEGLLEYNETTRFTIKTALYKLKTQNLSIKIDNLPPFYDDDYMTFILKENLPMDIANQYTIIDNTIISVIANTLPDNCNINQIYHILFDRACLYLLQISKLIKMVDPPTLTKYTMISIVFAYILFAIKRSNTNLAKLYKLCNVTSTMINEILVLDIQFLGKTLLDKMLESMRPLTPEKIARAHEINKYCFVNNLYTLGLQSMSPDVFVESLREFANSKEDVGSLNYTKFHPAVSVGGRRRTPKKPRKSTTRRKRAGV